MEGGRQAGNFAPAVLLLLHLLNLLGELLLFGCILLMQLQFQPELIPVLKLGFQYFCIIHNPLLQLGQISFRLMRCMLSQLLLHGFQRGACFTAQAFGIVQLLPYLLFLHRADLRQMV